ncbi:MAG: Sulphatase-modifying factor protein [Myxococcaceae bacterium]|nr:Sulphatase-modifying factor protein [Myxococcaceae bacterium]
MRSLVGLVDLARVVASFPRDEACDAVTVVGFDRAETPAVDVPEVPPRERYQPQPSPQQRFDDAVAGLETTPTDEPASFWRAERYLPPAASEQGTPRDEAVGLSSAEARGEGDSLFAAPEPPPLTPWRRLWPVLQSALHAVRAAKEPDVNELVRCWLRGEPVVVVPRVQRRAWADRASLWIDRNPKLVPLWHDQRRVERGLRAVFGRALDVRWLDRAAHARAARSPRGWIEGHRPDPVRPVLILGDLGGRAEVDRQRWREALRALHAAGVQATALVPQSAREMDQSSARVVSWEMRASHDDPAALDRLMLIASAASTAPPGLLRALRWLLPEATVGTELEAWNHPAVEAADGTGLLLRSKMRATLRARFRELDESLQRRVDEVLRRWRARAPAELRYAEAIAWRQFASPAVGRADHAEAVSYMERLAVTLSRPERGSMERDGLRHYGGAMLDGMPASGYREVPALARIWDAAHEGTDEVEPPEGVDIAALRAARRGERPTMAWALRQVGGALTYAPLGDASQADHVRPGSPVATLEASGPELLLSRPVSRLQQMIHRGLTTSLGGAEQLTLDAARGALQLRRWSRDRWARAAGRDRHGLWALFTVGRVEYRMRWIPPGRFEMGSPEDEAGRLSEEGPQHQVALTSGYWLGETPVTHGLWAAVMGLTPTATVRVYEIAEDLKVDTDAVLQKIRALGIEARNKMSKVDAAYLDQIRTVLLREKQAQFVEVEVAPGVKKLRRVEPPPKREPEPAIRAVEPLPKPVRFGDSDRSVDGVSWSDCAVFVSVLNERVEGLGVRLPTEAEWEYACRAGTATATWVGNLTLSDDAVRAKELDAIARYGGDIVGGTSDGLRRVPNPHGLYDLLGNVQEWCADWSGPYDASPAVDPIGPSTGSARVARGGSWIDHARSLRAAARFAHSPDERVHGVGLRLGRGPQ